MTRRTHVDELRGATRLAFEATRGITSLVEEMHVAIASGPAVLGQPLAAPARAFTRPIYGLIQGAMRLVGGGVDRALAELTPLLGASAPGPERAALRAVLNGVLGDYLHERGNPLAIELALRRAGAPLPLSPEALRDALSPTDASLDGPLVVLVHGSCMHDLQWSRGGHDHGAALARDLGATAVYAHYNTGRHISTNGALLAAQLERLAAAWPAPLGAIALVGHSMGGLVARAAAHAGAQAGHAWRRQLRALVTLGSPHHGAPLERGGALVDLALGLSRYSAPLARLGKIRSAGVTDLRYGNVRDEDWQGVDRFAPRGDRRTPLPLPDDVACAAIAATLSPTGAAHPLGDGLVPVDSALGVHPSPGRDLGISASRRLVVPAAGHLDLLDAPPVYAQLRAWLAEVAAQNR